MHAPLSLSGGGMIIMLLCIMKKSTLVKFSIIINNFYASQRNLRTKDLLPRHILSNAVHVVAFK